MERKSRARLMGFMAALLTMAALLWTLFAVPTVGAVADGSYVTTATAMALEYDAQRVDAQGRMETFAYTDTAYSTLLLGETSSMGAAVALVRLCTHPFGLEFSTRYLAFVYAALIAWGAYLAVSGLMRRSRMLAMLAMVAYPMLMMHSSIVGYLNSLYAIGAAMAYLLLFVGALMHVLCQQKGKGWHHTLLVLVLGTLLLRSMVQMSALVPFVVLGVVATAIHSCPGKGWRLLQVFCTVMVSIFCVVNVANTYANDKTVSSTAADYLAVFQGYLPASEHPEETLDALGLPQDFLADSGRSYYEAEENFVHNPREEETAALLAETIGLSRRLSYCLTHPETIGNILENNKIALQDAYSYYIINDAGQTHQPRLSPYAILETVFGRGGYQNNASRMLLCAVLLLVVLWLSHRQAGSGLLCLTMAVGMLCGVVYLPLCVALTGGYDLTVMKAFLFLMGWMALMLMVGCAAMVIQCGMEWLRTAQGKLLLAPMPAGQEAGFLLTLRRVSISRQMVVSLTAVACIALSCWQLLPEEHIAGVNNGDYGRMMEQIDLYWQEEQLRDTSTQMSSQVVEDYSYREPFHPERLTSLDPTYSLLFPSMVVRFITFFTGGGYSTQIQAFVLLALTIASLLLILHDLYPLLGKVTALLALLMTCMLLGENYIAWYNSLFGETMIPVGLMMTIACAVHLAMMERGSRKSWLWMLLLAISVRTLCCAKAQMALALPAGIVLLVAFAVYHRPQETKRMAAFLTMSAVLVGLVSWDAIGVYRKNQGVSEEQTIWQSVFYGALMIADDPDAAMEELGIPPEMKADIGKHAYYDSRDYVYAIGSQELREKFYDHVSTVSMVKYYLRHPKDLFRMMDRAAQESVQLSANFMTYTGMQYSDNQPMYRFQVWRYIRGAFAGRAFWQYVLGYGAIVVACTVLLIRKKTAPDEKLLITLLLCVMFVGVMQYPLSVIGNGFADNNKQMYTFMLCHDLLLITCVTIAVRKLIPKSFLREKGEEHHAKKEESA